MKRTVQMKKGNAGGNYTGSAGCRHNPQGPLRSLRKSMEKHREIHGAVLSWWPRMVGPRSPRQALVLAVNTVLAQCFKAVPRLYERLKVR